MFITSAIVDIFTAHRMLAIVRCVYVNYSEIRSVVSFYKTLGGVALFIIDPTQLMSNHIQRLAEWEETISINIPSFTDYCSIMMVSKFCNVQYVFATSFSRYYQNRSILHLEILLQYFLDNNICFQ